ncbi:MAG: hypothetical protein JWR46_1142 [Mycobacterium sp.]|jgi:hypothetical protein|nr:hypothetical protein [Mycobacterium sp.]
MTPRNGIPVYVMGDAAAGAARREVRDIALADVPLSKRMWARLFPAHYDQQIERASPSQPVRPWLRTTSGWHRVASARTWPRR